MSSRLIKNLLLQASGSLCVKGISLLLVPISTRFLMPEDFGLYALYNSFISIVAVFIALGLRQVFWLEFCRKQPYERRHMLNDMIIIYCCVAAPLLGLFFFYRTFVNNILFMGYGTSLMLAISLLICFLIFFVELLYQVLIYQQRVGQSLFLQAVSVAVTVTTALIFLHAGFKVTGMLLAQLIGSVVVSCYGLYQYYTKDMAQTMSFERVCVTWKQYLKDGLPFVPSLLSMWIISSSTRWLLAYYSLAITGIYAVVEMVATVFQLLFIRPLQTVYAPALFQQFVDAGPCIALVDRHNKQLMWLTMAVLSLLTALGYWLLSPYVLRFLPPAYAAAVPLSLLMAAAQIILVGAAFSICYIQFRKKMLYLSGALLCTAFVNALLCWLLVPWLQAAGALIAFLCAVLVYFIFTLWYNQRLHGQV
jgi:O-antigen/teichoic acid export membrane protein